MAKIRGYVKIDNLCSIEWGLSLQEAYLFDYLVESGWADVLNYQNVNYRFISKTKVIDDLPLISSKKDTIYRYYKSLIQKGLILYVKIDNKDYISITEKGLKWNNKDTSIRDSDSNPSEYGFKSENNSDLNPTYRYNNNIIDKDNIDINILTNINKKKAVDENWLNKLIFEENLTNVTKIKNQITNAELEKLENLYTNEQIIDVVYKLANYKTTKKYESVYLTLNNWLKKEITQPTYTNKKNNLNKSDMLQIIQGMDKYQLGDFIKKYYNSFYTQMISDSRLDDENTRRGAVEWLINTKQPENI